MKNRKGILLFSGGLDSLLSAKILMDQNIDLMGLHFVLPFYCPDIQWEKTRVFKQAEEIGLPISFQRCEMEYMNMVQNPPHGYGKNINPCIDCKIFFLRKAKELMEKEGASFVATGEVVGQRPMSQKRNTLNHIEKESGLQGYLLRPLSAKLLRPTKSEMEGIVSREGLMGINGRSRKIQMQLMEKYDIKDYASPAGGCFLTDKNVAGRIRDLFEYFPDYTMIDVYLLSIGRHYRLHKDAKIIVSRNEGEGLVLEKYKEKSDYFMIPEFNGAQIFVKGMLYDSDFKILGSISRRYGKCDTDEAKIAVFPRGCDPITLVANEAVSDDFLDGLRI